jgi:hypothetical protein
MITVQIHEGSHYTDRVVLEYSPVGSFDVVEEGARSMCGSLEETAGKRVWVDFRDEEGWVLTHRIFQEG